MTVTLTAFSQERSFGVRAGLNVASMTSKEDGASYSMDSRATFHAGFAYEQPLLRALPLYLETGLYLSGRGSTIKEEGDKWKYNMLYLQVPVSIGWRFNLGSVSLQPAVGAYYGLGIHGKMKYTGAEGGSFKIDVFKDDEVRGVDVSQRFKRSDVGLRFGVGAAISKHYYVGAGYDLGLLNIYKDSDEAKVKNRSFFISLGYNF